MNATFHLEVLDRAIDLLGQAARVSAGSEAAFETLEAEIAFGETRESIAHLWLCLLPRAGSPVTEPMLNASEPARDASCQPTI